MKLKTKLSKLRHDGYITDAEYSIIINALNRKPKERVIAEIKVDEDTLRKLVKDKVDELTTKFATEPCEDCISRAEAIKEFQIFREYSSNRSNADWVDRIETVLMHLPPVTPQAEPCEDCISREAVENITWEEPSYTDVLNVLTEVREKIRQLPPVTPQQKVGKWIDEGFYAEGHSEHAYRCSECGEHYIGYVGEFKYCPSCGTKMEVEK